MAFCFALLCSCACPVLYTVAALLSTSSSDCSKNPARQVSFNGREPTSDPSTITSPAPRTPSALSKAREMTSLQYSTANYGPLPTRSRAQKIRPRFRCSLAAPIRARRYRRAERRSSILRGTSQSMSPGARGCSVEPKSSPTQLYGIVPYPATWFCNAERPWGRRMGYRTPAVSCIVLPTQHLLCAPSLPTRYT